MRTFLLLLILYCAYLSSVFAQKAQSLSDYKIYNLSGFQVYVQKTALTQHPHTTGQAVSLLKHKLLIISKLPLKMSAEKHLKTVRVFMDWNANAKKAAQYHISKQWLMNNGYIPEMAKAVHISSIQNFVNWSKQNQPEMILHELAHAYHDQVLGDGHREIKQAYDKAMKLKLYESVGYNAGNDSKITKARAYGANNHLEYFAELTEAFFGKNDYYPFTKKDLKLHDPKAYALLTKIWQGKNLSIHINISSKKSKQSSKRATLLLKNKSNELLYGYWVDFHGKEIFYFKIRAGQEVKQATYTKHLWRLKNTDGRLVKELRPSQSYQKVVID
ncbi:zinc-dependent peptidase [uncultured Microscilla sp.]|uniref:zinc-dependent peptidase n=1 Tax=uncultured Microscilla sp. TaxID=432653 RepID=UPI00263052C6|nr:zinc-dependent peptidase [uncultured Microscilla sp.]